MVIKRILDIIISLIAIIIFLPGLILLALLVRVNLGSPIFFLQERIGLHHKPFKIIKFRTMNNVKDKNGEVLPDENRLSTFGRTLRATSLDELPELINVLKGEMSIVGPRPLLPEYMDKYSKEQLRRHERVPGITGWAQINGRNAISWKEKFNLDIWYIDNWSLFLDLKIILQTFKKVIVKEGINQDDNIIMEHFNGSN